MQLLQAPDAASDPVRFQNLMKEQSELLPIVESWRAYQECLDNKQEAILILDYNGEAAEKEEFLKGLEALQNVDAIINDRIYVANCADMQGSAGSAQLVEDIAKQLYPDKF